MKAEPSFELVSARPLSLKSSNRLANMYVLSPFVWHDGDCWHIMARAVPRRDDEPRLKMAEAWHGTSRDGFEFDMDIAPAIFPGPDKADLDGCEDPTVMVDKEGLRVWYTGYNQAEETGRIMLALGTGPGALEKQGVALGSTNLFANPKESTVVAAGEGWRMMFEYARDGASLIGEVRSDSLDGPWSDRKSGLIEPRPESWDCWHLSPGPIIGEGSDAPVMFYNGATRDAAWRIGWALFDRDFSRVIARSDEPLISPEDGRDEGASDIAFVASAVEHGGEIRIYFSQSDRDIRCAIVRRV